MISSRELTDHQLALECALQLFPGSMVVTSNLPLFEKDESPYHRTPVPYFKYKTAPVDSMQEAFAKALDKNEAEPFFTLIKFLPEDKKEVYREIYRKWKQANPSKRSTPNP